MVFPHLVREAIHQPPISPAAELGRYKLGKRTNEKEKKIKKRKGKADDTVSSRIGIAWYRREQWDRLLEISSDRNELEDTYDEWQAVAEANLRKLARRGYVLHKVDIDVEELLSWCNSQNRSVDGGVRSEFTVVKLRELDEAGK